MSASIDRFYRIAFSIALLISPTFYTATKTHKAMFNPGRVNQMRDERRASESWVTTKDAHKKETPKKQGWFQKKTLRDMSYDEIKVAKDGLLAKKNYYIALKYLERMLKLCDNLNEMADLLLEFADTLWADNKHEKAGKVYQEFASLYPGSDQAEYALYKAILCTEQSVLEADRDQTATRDTIALADKFLERADLFKKYAPDVEEIRTRCYKKLAASELNVCEFFKKSGKYKQAQRRLEIIRTDWFAKLPELEPTIIAFEKDLAELQNDTHMFELKQQELVTKFPDHLITIAQNTPKKKSFISRF